MADVVTIVGGTGALGFGLALRLGQQGFGVVIGSRDAGRAAESAAAAKGKVRDGDFTGLTNDEAATQAATVFLCVPFRNQSENLTNLKHVLREGQLLVDATVPLAAAVSGKATRVLGVPQGSAAQQALELAPDGVRVVSALHTVSAASLADLAHDLDEDVLVCGDKRADKQQAADIIDTIPGLRCVDAGRLELSRIVESMTALMISVNAKYKTHAGVKLTGLPDDLWPPLKPKG